MSNPFESPEDLLSPTSPDSNLESESFKFAKKFEDDFSRFLGERLQATAETKVKQAGESVNFIGTFRNSAGEEMGSLMLSFREGQLSISNITVEEKFRELKLAKGIYQFMADFLRREKPDVKVRAGNFHPASQRLFEEYFDVTEQKGTKYIGRLKEERR
jgi:hypothetical protein